jgi:hypothetical protein
MLVDEDLVIRVVVWYDAWYEEGPCTHDQLDGFFKMISVGLAPKEMPRDEKSKSKRNHEFGNCAFSMDFIVHDGRFRHNSCIPAPMVSKCYDIPLKAVLDGKLLVKEVAD